jgi:hypothetical protein
MKRNPTTEAFYPDPVTCKEFIESIMEDFKPFLANMRYLGQDTKGMTMEEWMETFCAWNEIFPEGIIKE